MIDARTHLWSADVLPEFRLGLENLRAHKLRSLLTMLGMIFGVAAVVAMLSIGAGAQQEVMAFIEQLGVRNLIVEAREAPDNQTLQKVRKLSAGLEVDPASARRRLADRLRRVSVVPGDREPSGGDGPFLRRR
jgi:MacB-like protein